MIAFALAVRTESVPAPFAIGVETAADVAARDRLLDRAMQLNWRRKASEKLRRGRLPAIALVARDGAGSVVGTVRLWQVAVSRAPASPSWGGRAEGAGGVNANMPSAPSLRSDLPGQATGLARPSAPHKGEGESVKALLLGPLAVDPSFQGGGVGSALMRAAIEAARAGGHGAVLLMGDPEYYARFGFSAEKTGRLAMPGPFEKRRFLAMELTAGALDGAAGILKAAGEKVEGYRRAA